MRLLLFFLTIFLISCASEKGTIAELKREKILIEDAEIEGDLEDILQEYQLDPNQMAESDQSPEFILSLADLKISQEFDFSDKQLINGSVDSLASKRVKGVPGQSAGTKEAISLYMKLLVNYPKFERNDHVLYQLARIYEELGKPDKAIKMLDRLVKYYSKSLYIPEVQFRRGEHYYAFKKYSIAKRAYQVNVFLGVSSRYYELSLYKLGWANYKLELYEDAMQQFIALLDYKDATGYDFEHGKPANEDKRIVDAYNAISLSFSYLGGADTVTAYFKKHGERVYESSIYKNLGDYYFEKQRYSDAATTFKEFPRNNPEHRLAPYFDIWAVDSYKKGGFSKLVIESYIEFFSKYGSESFYRAHYKGVIDKEIIAFLKKSLEELANYYHAQYQDARYAKNRDENFREAVRWYKAMLNEFRNDDSAPDIHYRLAELLLENNLFDQAAVEFERITYEYPPHARSAQAGYTSIYALRKGLEIAPHEDIERIKREVITMSLKFAEAFRDNEKSTLVLMAALDDIYGLKDYELSASISRKLLSKYVADSDTRRDAWIIFAHSSFELGRFKDAEEGYLSAQKLIKGTGKPNEGISENLAASFYKKGEQFSKLGDHKSAAAYLLLVGRYAPGATIRATADFDAAAALMQIKDWSAAEKVLVELRERYPKFELHQDVTKKLAFIYMQKGSLSLAAAEYERMGSESTDPAFRRGAWETAIDLYSQENHPDKCFPIYIRYVAEFKAPLGNILEYRNKIAMHFKAANQMDAYYSELKRISDAYNSDKSGRSDRARFIAAKASLVLAELKFELFSEIKLTKPFSEYLQKKKESMSVLKEQLDELFNFEVDEVTSAATYFLAEMYFDFSRALTESERPDDLDGLEQEQYELSIEEQAYPFEEKAIKIHEKNMELRKSGMRNVWIERSALKLSKLVPAEYGKSVMKSR